MASDFNPYAAPETDVIHAADVSESRASGAITLIARCTHLYLLTVGFSFLFVASYRLIFTSTPPMLVIPAVVFFAVIVLLSMVAVWVSESVLVDRNRR